MSGSDTPRCDAYEIRDGIRYVSVPRSDLPNWSSFARQLERELSCAQENFHVTNQAYVKADARAEKAERALAQSQAMCAEVKKDAARYRWLRDVGDDTWTPLSKRITVADNGRPLSMKEIEAHIDTALKSR